jgi:hypothetical protein
MIESRVHQVAGFFRRDNFDSSELLRRVCADRWHVLDRGAGKQATSQRPPPQRERVLPRSIAMAWGSWPDAYESWHAVPAENLVLIVALLLLLSVVFSFACGFTVLDTTLTIMIAQIIQGSYFLGLVIRAIFTATHCMRPAL